MRNNMPPSYLVLLNITIHGEPCTNLNIAARREGGEGASIKLKIAPLAVTRPYATFSSPLPTTEKKVV